MDEDRDPLSTIPRRPWFGPLVTWLALLTAVALSAYLFNAPPSAATGAHADIAAGAALDAGARELIAVPPEERIPWTTVLPAPVLLLLGVLLFLSAFFSGSETAFFSINKLRLRAMRDDERPTARAVARMMEQQGRLLTTILVGNIFINVLIGVLMGSRVEQLFQYSFGLSPFIAYPVAIAVATGSIVFFGEILPKVLAVTTSEGFARFAVLPLRASDRVLTPLRDGVMRLTDLIFTLIRFHERRAAPFITDEELKAVISDTKVEGSIEEEERQMIQGILEFSNVLLREILVPRPDVVALPQDATVACALDTLREHEFSRMPVYEEDLDHVIGVLMTKDLIPCFAKGELDRPVRDFVRPAHFVPETMKVRQFVEDAQRRRTHLAVVVDEYGGTAGIVTLEDAIEEVVGEILDENEKSQTPHELLGENMYRVEGGMDLEELSELIGIEVRDEEHETVAGFLMNHSDKVLEAGDRIEHDGVVFTVESTEGKRVNHVHIEARRSQPERKDAE